MKRFFLFLGLYCTMSLMCAHNTSIKYQKGSVFYQESTLSKAIFQSSRNLESCDSIYELPYYNDFSNYQSEQNPCEAGAPLPECWSFVSNGLFTRDTDPNEYIYFSGITSTFSISNYGCITEEDPFLSLIACKIYTGNDPYYIEDMVYQGTCKYAILPKFNHSMSQTTLSFDHRTSDVGGILLIGYTINNDTTTFVVLDSILSDYQILHHDTFKFNKFNAIPEEAQITLCWKAIGTSTYTSNIYCGIDNISIVLDNSDPEPIESTIDFSEILFWVGEGSKRAVMAVNWVDTALAWGFKWDGNATVADMMSHISAADPRFSYVGSGLITDINFIDTLANMSTPLGITPGNYWESKNNGLTDGGLSQILNDGDLEKWADPAAGVIVDSVYYAGWGWSYINVYPMTIYPVSVPDTNSSTPTIDSEHGPFCGPVGSEGCTAIAADDNVFVAWASNVVVTRGLVDITNPMGQLASFGGDTNAIGPATLDNTMDAVSLGDGGSALIYFEQPIRNGEGPDFAVFENALDDNFLELAFVEVSSDGVHFVRFPATSLIQTETQTGTFGGTDPTFINNLAGKFRIGYGTPFDLEELSDSANINIDSVIFVRVVDVIGTINPEYASYDAFGHIINDPWPTDFNSGGFDLTGVGVIHNRPVGIENHKVSNIHVYPNPCSNTLYIMNDSSEKVELYNVNGKLLNLDNSGEKKVAIDMKSYPAGFYLLKVGNKVQKILKK